MRKNSIPLGIAGLALAALALAGCSGSGGAGSAASAPASPSQSSGGASASSPAGDTLKTASSPLGHIVVDANGMTVYYFKKDTKGESAATCTGACATYWPPVTTSGMPKLTGVSGTVGTIAGPNGAKQVTIDGLPIYTYVGDSKPGDVAGQGSNGFGAKWWVVAPDGSAITKSVQSPSPAGSGPGSGSGYGY
jgi:predicted lipoprotein with Yx(FWY)xxD motif